MEKNTEDEKSVNLKLFGKNTLIYALGNIGLRAASFLLIPLYTHALPIKEYGLLATLLLTIQIMSIFMGLGSRTAFIRFAAEYKKEDRLDQLFGSSILINFMGGLVISALSLTVLLPLFRLLLHINNIRAFIMLTSFAALAQTLWMHVISYFRAHNDGKSFVFFSIVAFFLLVFFNVVLVVYLRKGIYGVLFAQIITYGLLWLLVMTKIILQIGFAFSGAVFKSILRFGFPLIFSMSGDLITDSSALYLLSFFAGLEQVAIYSLGYKIAQIAVITLILPFQLAYEPMVYANIHSTKIKKFIAEIFVYLLIAFAFLAMGIVYIFRDLIHLVAPSEYNLSYSTVFLFLPGIAFIGVYYVAESLLNIEKKTSVTGSVISIMTAVSLVLNYFFIRKYGMYGALAVFNFTHISIALILLFYGLKYFPIPINLKKFATSIALLFGLLGLTFLLKNSSAFIFYPVIPAIALGIIGWLFYSQFFGFDILKMKTAPGVHPDE